MFFSIKSGGPCVTKDLRFGAACNRVTEPFQRSVADMICCDSEQLLATRFAGDLSQIWKLFTIFFRRLQRPVAGMICRNSEQLLATCFAGVFDCDSQALKQGSGARPGGSGFYQNAVSDSSSGEPLRGAAAGWFRCPDPWQILLVLWQGKGASDGSFDSRKSYDFCCHKARNSYEKCASKPQYS